MPAARGAATRRRPRQRVVRRGAVRAARELRERRSRAAGRRGLARARRVHKQRPRRQRRRLFDVPEPSESISIYIKNRGRADGGHAMAHVTLEHKNLRAALIVVSRRVRVLLALVFRRARVAAARQRRPLRVRAVVPARCDIAEECMQRRHASLLRSELRAEALCHIGLDESRRERPARIEGLTAPPPRHRRDGTPQTLAATRTSGAGTPWPDRACRPSARPSRARTCRASRPRRRRPASRRPRRAPPSRCRGSSRTSWSPRPAGAPTTTRRPTTR